jgi:hypothetical protein
VYTLSLIEFITDSRLDRPVTLSSNVLFDLIKLKAPNTASAFLFFSLSDLNSEEMAFNKDVIKSSAVLFSL